MMISLRECVRLGHSRVRRWVLDPRIHRTAQVLTYLLAGFCLSAAAIGNYSMPLTLGLICACGGWSALAVAVGGALGYWVFWNTAGYMGLLWVLMGLPVGLFLAQRSKQPLLIPAVSALIAAASGLIFQLALQDMTPIPIYLLRVALAAGAAAVFSRVLQGRSPFSDWLGAGLLVLALAQIVPVSYLGLGYLAAGIIAGFGTFPGAVVAGLALDVAQVTPMPMTAVLALGYLIRFWPRHSKFMAAFSPATVYVAMMSLHGVWDLQPLPALLAGSLLGTYLPLATQFVHRRGETGVAQVRLELASGVLRQTESLLQEVEGAPVDEDALMARAAERACGGCACRKNCRDSLRLVQLSPVTLYKPLLSTDELPIICRKPGRYLAELHRCQEQLRSIRADRQRQKEYRAAVIQQYRFLASFLQDLADGLPRKAEPAQNRFSPEVMVFGNRPEGDNGDRCVWFPGVGKKYYVLLCDGMGTGIGAVHEGRTAAALLKRMLCAGYPAEHALRSLNSLCALRDKAGAVTADLAELMLDSGKVNLYKWGACPSYVSGKLGAERLGAVSPPPGISVTQEQEQVEHTDLRRGQWLVMVSDGVESRWALRCCMERGERSAGELASGILAGGQPGKQDDATVVIVKLKGA